MTSYGYSTRGCGAIFGGGLGGVPIEGGWAGDVYRNYLVMGMMECILESGMTKKGVVSSQQRKE